MTPTAPKFKQWCKTHTDEALRVVTATAFAQVERKRVDAYLLPLFRSFQFRFPEGGLIENPEHLYRCLDEVEVARYYDACDTAHREHGFAGPYGYCPALIAHHDQLKAEWRLLEAAAQFFALDSPPTKSADREKFLRLVIGACLNVPIEKADA